MLCDLHTSISPIIAFCVSLCYSCRPFIIFIKSVWKLQKIVSVTTCLSLEDNNKKNWWSYCRLSFIRMTMINDDIEVCNPFLSMKLSASLTKHRNGGNKRNIERFKRAAIFYTMWMTYKWETIWATQIRESYLLLTSRQFKSSLFLHLVNIII